MKLLLNIFMTWMLLCVAACSGVSNSATVNGVDASDDELLASLASLARRGTNAVCDPAVLERELGIKFGAFITDKPDSEIARQLQRVHQYTDEIFSNSKSKAIESARYVRSSGLDGRGCQLSVRFSDQRFCDAWSAQIQKIMGVPLVRGSPSPHGIDYPYEYHYVPVNGETAVIYLGASNKKCANEFSLTSGENK